MTDGSRPPLAPSEGGPGKSDPTSPDTYEVKALRRLMANVQIDAGSGCWVWTGKRNDKGFGRTSFRNKDSAAHRVMYELVRGKTPSGHLSARCRNRACVNPDHLTEATSAEILRRGSTLAAANAAKTHCPQGHPYSGDNLAFSGGSRMCRECWRIKARERYHKAREGVPGKYQPMRPGEYRCTECARSTTKLVRQRCSACYSRQAERSKKAGTWVPIADLEPRDPKVRLFSRVTPGPNGCWIWTGAIVRGGYGQVYVPGQGMRFAHRVAYELAKGPIPDGLVIDHRCHNVDKTCRHGGECFHRRCINPDHLDAVTLRENVLRSPITMAHRWATRTHCNHGHEWTPENTVMHRVRGRLVRRCRACRGRRSRQRAGQKRAQRRRGGGA